MATRHKVFISFYHYDDEAYKDALERDFGHLMIGKSVDDGEIDTDNSDEYAKRLIREDFISDSSVVVVLTGPNTRKRKHVDWEIYAGLTSMARGNSGLIGVMLPELARAQNGGWYYEDMPGRLADNIKSEYATFCSWTDFTSHFSHYLETAFNNKISLKRNIDNRRTQMQRNLA